VPTADARRNVAREVAPIRGASMGRLARALLAAALCTGGTGAAQPFVCNGAFSLSFSVAVELAKVERVVQLAVAGESNASLVATRLVDPQRVWLELDYYNDTISAVQLAALLEATFAGLGRA